MATLMSVDTLSGIRCGRSLESRYWYYHDTLIGTRVVPPWDHSDTPRSILSDSCHLPINFNLKLGHPYRHGHRLSPIAASRETQAHAMVFPAGSSHSTHRCHPCLRCGVH